MDDIELFLVALVVFLGDFATYILNVFFGNGRPPIFKQILELDQNSTFSLSRLSKNLVLQGPKMQFFLV